jgi:phosphatidylserine/phosphatidylglycerophosphate/cardiolipin synthase-like enzyme
MFGNNLVRRNVARSVMDLSSRLNMFWKSSRSPHALAVSTPASVFCPGRNCLDVVQAGRASVLVDGMDYFHHLENSLRRARHSIIIIGWDFDGRIRLRPQVSEAESPPLGPLLRELVETMPELSVRILVWSISVLHGPSAVAPALFGSDWQHHPRSQFKFDTQHPFYGSHHQKIVGIDGAIAFVGGMDLTVRRWDTPDHLPDDSRRIDCDGEPYPPVHDVQMVFDGDAAAKVCSMAGERWRAATGEFPGDGTSQDRKRDRRIEGPWPDGLTPDFRLPAIAIARTEPAYAGHTEIRESSVQALDMIAAAEHSIYIEAQYLTAKSVGAALSRRLKARTGPDIIIVMTQKSRGLLERFAMSENRDRLIRRLARADRFRRLRVFYPVVPLGSGEIEVLVHAKLLIIDDRLIRVGSSNLNNRSIGLDTECDVAIEAKHPMDRSAIAGIRNRLLAEHLDCREDEVDAAVKEAGLLAAVDRLNRNRRRLRPFELHKPGGSFRSIPGTRFLDPVRMLRLPWPFR